MGGNDTAADESDTNPRKKAKRRNLFRNVGFSPSVSFSARKPPKPKPAAPEATDPIPTIPDLSAADAMTKNKENTQSVEELVLTAKRKRAPVSKSLGGSALSSPFGNGSLN